MKSRGESQTLFKPRASAVDWRYAMCPMDIHPRFFGPFAELVERWHKRRGAGGRLPRRSDFEMKDFKGWFGQIFIARLEREPFNLRFTLWGTQLVEWWQVDYTNKTLGSQSLDPEAWKSSELRYFQEMDKAAFIGITSGRLTQHEREFIKVMAVDLPLSEGHGISHVISAHIQVELEDEIETLLPDCPFTVL